MKITSQQALCLFDIVKGCLYDSKEQFAGYSKDDIKRLLNDIIMQQDNIKIITTPGISDYSPTIQENKELIIPESEDIKEKPESNETGFNDEFWGD